MNSNRIVKFDPWLLGAIQKVMGKLPAIPGDLAKVKSLTFSDGGYLLGDEGLLLNGWLELASGDFSAIGKMPNLHTLLFRNRNTMKIGNYDFLCQCQKLKKLDLSGTDFFDCGLLAELPHLQYVLLPDRRQLVHTQVLERIQAQAETKSEMYARSRAKFCIDMAERKTQKLHTDTYTADIRLIYWFAVSLGKMPETPKDLEKIRLLDSRKRIPSLENLILDHLMEKLPTWLTAKKGDFSLIGKLPNLQALLLWGVVLDDFSFLSECRELVYVNLWDTNFTDCSLLSELPNIHEIYLPEKGQLENFSLLEKRRDTNQQKARQKLEDFLYHENSSELSEAKQVETEQALVRPTAFFLECEGDSEQETVCVKRSEHPVTIEIPEPVQKTKVTNVLNQEKDSDVPVIVRGEDVVISYEGKSRVRHVEAEFYMDQTPTLWEVFSRVRDEEDNWAKLSSQITRQLTDILMDAIIKNNVSTLCISLEPWGEGHNFVLDFIDGWVDITYMDDETPVYYHSYNPVYTNSTELLPIEFLGQSPVTIPKMLALDDIKLTVEIVRHFLATGQLLPGTLWKKATRGEF
ncbi:MAG: hypothetical protein K2N44_12760 [Lachnospiraceae bacterium]|nr:hypothetical protein [Lachnospiraceae bacterium]